MRIGARNEKGVDACLGHACAQCGKTRRNVAPVGLFLKALELGGREGLGGHRRRSLDRTAYRSWLACCSGHGNFRPAPYLSGRTKESEDGTGQEFRRTGFGRDDGRPRTSGTALRRTLRTRLRQAEPRINEAVTGPAS